MQESAPGPSLLSFPQILWGFLIPAPLSPQGLSWAWKWAGLAVREVAWEGTAEAPHPCSREPGGLQAAVPFSVDCFPHHPIPGTGASDTPPGCGQIREVLQVAGSLGETQSGYHVMNMGPHTALL